jgi:hypothetical protein
MKQNPLNISFRRALTGDKLTSWHNLVAKVSLQQLSQWRDSFTWDLHRHGCFTIQSMYQYLMNQCAPFTNKFIWNLRIPLKTEIFLWYL